MKVDRFDRKLLNLVQADGGQTAERLAEQVALTPSAIQRSLRRRREKSVQEVFCVTGEADFVLVVTGHFLGWRRQVRKSR